MGSTQTLPPDSGPDLPALPPISISALAVGLCDLLQRAVDLPAPSSVTIYDSRAGGEHFTLQFRPVPESLTAIQQWARRFGCEATTRTRTDDDGTPEQWVKAEFDWFGVSVDAFVHIPLT